MNVLAAHAAVVFNQPVDLRAVAQIIGEAAVDKIIAVDRLPVANKRALPKAAAPQRHDGQRAVILLADDFRAHVCRGAALTLLVCAFFRLRLELLRGLACITRKAVLLVEHRLNGLVLVKPPVAHARAQRAGRFIP